MSLPFRRRLFLAIAGLGILPAAGALLVLALQIQSTSLGRGPGAAFDQVVHTGGVLIVALDTAALDTAARVALRTHTNTIAHQARRAHQAETVTRSAATLLGAGILVVAGIVVVASLVLSRRWARYVSAPVEELVDWVSRVERGEPLPDGHHGGAPEFEALRDAVRQLAEALARVRTQEVEQARLTAFRETARSVAHEMRGPLSATRLALRQLPAAGEATEILRDETARLERIAAEFAEFGRLPEGPEAEVDMADLLERVAAGVSEAGCPVSRNVEPGLSVRGHYEPLRRAVENVVRNAVAFTDGTGIAIVARRSAGGIEVTVRDHGPGVPDDMKDRIFEPYVTTRKGGTGLGLALVRQTVRAHGGHVTVSDAAGGGAQFTITLPGTP